LQIGPDNFSEFDFLTANVNEQSNHIQQIPYSKQNQNNKYLIDHGNVFSNEKSLFEELLRDETSEKLYNLPPQNANQIYQRDRNCFGQGEDDAGPNWGEDKNDSTSNKDKSEDSSPHQVQELSQGKHSKETNDILEDILTFIDNFSGSQEEPLTISEDASYTIMQEVNPTLSETRTQDELFSCMDITEESPVARVEIDPENLTSTINILPTQTIVTKSKTVPCKDRCKAYRQRKKIKVNNQDNELHQLEGRNKTLKRDYGILEAKVRKMKQWYLSAIKCGQISCKNSLIPALVNHI